MPSNWLTDYLDLSVQRGDCTKIGCTTCGATDFRKGVWVAFAQARNLGTALPIGSEQVLEVTKSLSLVTPNASNMRDHEAAARCLIFDLWNSAPLHRSDIEQLLFGSWAGSVLETMRRHHETRERASQEHAARMLEGPRRKEEKRQIRQQNHAQRLAKKKERDSQRFEKR